MLHSNIATGLVVRGAEVPGRPRVPLGSYMIYNVYADVIQIIHYTHIYIYIYIYISYII